MRFARLDERRRPRRFSTAVWAGSTRLRRFAKAAPGNRLLVQIGMPLKAPASMAIRVVLRHVLRLFSRAGESCTASSPLDLWDVLAPPDSFGRHLGDQDGQKIALSRD